MHRGGPTPTPVTNDGAPMQRGEIVKTLQFGQRHVSSAGFPTPTSLASAARTLLRPGPAPFFTRRREVREGGSEK